VIPAVDGAAREVDESGGPLQLIGPRTEPFAVPVDVPHAGPVGRRSASEDDDIPAALGEPVGEESSEEAVAAGKDQFGIRRVHIVGALVSMAWRRTEIHGAD
jgi:hypothetical protein